MACPHTFTSKSILFEEYIDMPILHQIQTRRSHIKEELYESSRNQQRSNWNQRI